MSARKHCKFLRMITVRMSRDERAKIGKAAAAAKLPINTWCRRQLGLPDHAVEEQLTKAIATASACPFRIGQKVQHRSDGYTGIVIEIIQPGDMRGPAGSGDMVVERSPGVSRVTNCFADWQSESSVVTTPMANGSNWVKEKFEQATEVNK
jgi:hypothetical protein